MAQHRAVVHAVLEQMLAVPHNDVHDLKLILWQARGFDGVLRNPWLLLPLKLQLYGGTEMSTLLLLIIIIIIICQFMSIGCYNMARVTTGAPCSAQTAANINKMCIIFAIRHLFWSQQSLSITTEQTTRIHLTTTYQTAPLWWAWVMHLVVIPDSGSTH